MLYAKMSASDPTRQSYAIRADAIVEHCLGNESEPHCETLPRGVEVLLQAQKSAAHAFPYRAVGLHRRDPATVYVRQQMSASVGARKRIAAHPGTHVSPPKPEELAPKSIESALAAHRHILLTGDAGAGKSTLTLQLATREVELPEASDARLLPVRVLARELAARPHMRLLTAVMDAAQAQLARFLTHDLDPDLLEHDLPGYRWLIIVDALDEVTNTADRTDLAEQLMVFMEQFRAYSVLVTSRPLPEAERDRWEELKELTHFTIEPFRRDQRAEFAHSWFANDPGLGEKFLTQLSAARFREVASIPLLATVAAIVFEANPDRPLPASRFGLYEQYFSHLYDSRARQFHDDVRARLAGWPQTESIAQHLTESRVSLIEHLAPRALSNSPLLPEALIWLRAAGLEPTPPPPDWSAVVATALTSTGLLVHDGDGLRFTHHTFAEHICDALDARRLSPQFDPDDPSWWRTLWEACSLRRASARRTILHRALLGMNAEELLEWLLAHNDSARELAIEMASHGIMATPGQQAAISRTFDYWIWRATREVGFQNQVIKALRTVRNATRPLQRVLGDAIRDPEKPDTLRIEVAQALVACGEPNRSHGLNALRCFLSDDRFSGRCRIEAAKLLQEAGDFQAAQDGLFRLVNGASAHHVHRRAARDLLNIRSSELIGTNSCSLPPDQFDSPSRDKPTVPTATTMVDRSARELNSPSNLDAGFSGEEIPEWASPTLLVREHGDSERVLLGSPVPDNIVSYFALEGVVQVEDVAAAAVAEISEEITRQTKRRKALSKGRQRENFQIWSAIADWLTSQPANHESAAANQARDLVQKVPSLTAPDSHRFAGVSRAKRLTLAAVLARGDLAHQRACVDLVTFDVASWNPGQVVNLAYRLASSSTELNFLIISQLCRIVTNSKTTSVSRSVMLDAIRDLGADTAVQFLVGCSTLDPHLVVSTLLRLSPEYRADAVIYLESLASGSLDAKVHSWCQAAYELTRTPDTVDRNEAIRLIKRAAGRDRSAVERLAMAKTLTRYAPETTLQIVSAVVRDVETTKSEQLMAAQLLARLDHAPADVALHILDSLEGAAEPRELSFAAVLLTHIAPAVRDRCDRVLRAQLVHNDIGHSLRLEIVGALTSLSPQVRADLANQIDILSGKAKIKHAAWLTMLEAIALKGPDLHDLTQATLTKHALEHDSCDRISTITYIRDLDWRGNGTRAAAILSAIAVSDSETPAMRALAARKLLAYGQHFRLVAQDALRALTEQSDIAPLLKLQVCRELAIAGDRARALASLANMATDSALRDADRSEAAILMLMIDPWCSEITVSTLGAMSGDRTLTLDTREWVSNAPMLLQFEASRE
ncbi:NACHT domain-containing NTPase [Streptomyces sp. Ru73]|uniref:NACHT domain-containing protein n=1 Tax=Streptomyces sp. Ru73 TaxID=2080748 RepID=UPI0021560EC9|nr:NACHT domain-containing protein [Streptomyces sp. Ru73]